MSKPRSRNDLGITLFALAAATYEIVLGGGRFTVLAFLSTLLGVPVIASLESARRERRNARSD